MLTNYETEYIGRNGLVDRGRYTAKFGSAEKYWGGEINVNNAGCKPKKRTAQGSALGL